MSRIIIALDRVDRSLDWYKEFVSNTQEYVAGYKFGLPFLIRYGIKGFREISRLINKEKLWIIDFKLADISYIMIKSVEPFIEMGFNAFIAHSFIGRHGSLRELKEYFLENNSKLILIYTMSHQGAFDVLDKSISIIEEVIADIRPWGLVAPATRPEMIKRAKNFLHTNGIESKILSPGIGYQGAKPGTALQYGADYEIIGRLITYSSDPISKIKEINSIHKKVVRNE